MALHESAAMELQPGIVGRASTLSQKSCHTSRARIISIIVAVHLEGVNHVPEVRARPGGALCVCCLMGGNSLTVFVPWTSHEEVGQVHPAESILRT